MTEKHKKGRLNPLTFGQFPIEPNVPIPTLTNGHAAHPGKGKSVYPVATMQAGDSFFVPGKKAKVVGSSTSRLRTHILKEHPEGALELLLLEVKEDGVRGTRCWCIERTGC